MKSPFHNSLETSRFLKYLLVTVVIFLCVATTQIMLFDSHPTPRHYVIPILFALIVGSIIGWNAILRQRLEASNRVKSDFVSLISHEIRTPLTVINGFSKILAELSNLEGRDKDFARRIYYSGEHLLTIINDLLDMSALESGKLTVDIRELELTALLRDCGAMIQSMADSSGISLDFQLEDGSVRVMADQTRLKQVVINLLANAIKYNSKNGSVSISLDANSDNSCRVAIKDTGMGIPESKMKSIFVPFERLERDKNLIRGTGLGLSISKRLMDAMGGKIGCSSQPGKGSTFWIDIRKAG